jgi:hypothetical protein
MFESTVSNRYVYFTNNVRKVNSMNNIDYITDNQIKVIPQCYRYDANQALSLDNSIINEFIEKCYKNIDYSNSTGWKYTSLDTRVHMLKPGMLPCIGGWHCDDFYRGENNQPLLENINYNCPQIHYICTIGSTSLPEFVDMPLTLNIDSNAVYKSMNEQIEKIRNSIEIYTPRSGEIIKIGPDVIHRGVIATSNAWRVFMRLTFSNHRFPKNEIRTQTQVYLTSMDGW